LHELGSRNIRLYSTRFIETEMTSKLNEDVVQGWKSIPLKRAGTEDVANACLFLLQI
jgi:3-oxoacyl-[acyl-carrier protein] reductase